MMYLLAKRVIRLLNRITHVLYASHFSEMMYLLAKHAIRLFNLLALPGMLGTYVAHHPAVSGDGADGLAFILTGSCRECERSSCNVHLCSLFCVAP
jgi:hypothetical protein